MSVSCRALKDEHIRPHWLRNRPVTFPQKQTNNLLLLFHGCTDSHELLKSSRPMSLFPHAADMSDDHFWTGLRPMTPDGTPVIGKTPISNLFINTGHGTLGWTMSTGSGKLIADIVSGNETAISLDGLEMSRYPYADKVT